jgi:hypothetical protein
MAQQPPSLLLKNVYISESLQSCRVKMSEAAKQHVAKNAQNVLATAREVEYGSAYSGTIAVCGKAFEYTLGLPRGFGMSERQRAMEGDRLCRTAKLEVWVGGRRVMLNEEESQFFIRSCIFISRRAFLLGSIDEVSASIGPRSIGYFALSDIEGLLRKHRK